MLTFDAFQEAAALIPYQYRHPRMLYALVCWLEPEIVVEIGTHLGMSAVWMARALQEIGRGRLYCIDPFCWPEPQEELWQQHIDACGVRDVVTLIKGRSEEVEWPGYVDFAFIDGNHTYPVCQHDTEKARDRGAVCIALHDTVSWEGSRRYAEELRADADWATWDFLEAEFDCGMMIMKKRSPKGTCEGEDIGEKWDRPSAPDYDADGDTGCVPE